MTNEETISKMDESSNKIKFESKKSTSNNTSLSGRMGNFLFIALLLVGALVIYNQVQLSTISSSFDSLVGAAVGSQVSFKGDSADLSGVDISEISSTAMAVAAVFPELQNLQNENEIMNFMIPAGTPEYSEAIGGITFDDPVNSMEYLVRLHRNLMQEVQNNNPEGWQRYLDLAAQPKGISCEYCCGLGATGARPDGMSMCGCKHNPALLALTLGLIQNTDYSDIQILREAMKWKTMFFPKNMVGLAMQVAGTDPSQLKDLPGMVGGC